MSKEEERKDKHKKGQDLEESKSLEDETKNGITFINQTSTKSYTVLKEVKRSSFFCMNCVKNDD